MVAEEVSTNAAVLYGYFLSKRNYFHYVLNENRRESPILWCNVISYRYGQMAHSVFKAIN